MSTERIRPIVLCVCRDQERILVAELRDEVKGETFYRPLGGGIEFWERGEDAVQREFIEEVGCGLEKVCFLGMLENIFICEGKRGHEIVLVYDGRLKDERLYAQETIVVDEMGTPLRAVWKRLDWFGPGKPPLYPDGLLELMEGSC